MMGKCKSTSHKIFKDKEKNRVDDLQGMLTDLQFARKESRVVDVAVLEEQVHQMLREWKAELNEASPASSLQHGASHGSFSSDIYRLLQPREEEDDATSALAAPKPEPNDPNFQSDNTVLQEAFGMNQCEQDNIYPFISECKDSNTGIRNLAISHIEGNTQLDYNHFDVPHNFEAAFFATLNNTDLFVDNNLAQLSIYLPTICPPPSAFLGPKCALWDCPRPAQGGLDWCQDYCSSFHHALAVHESPIGMAPVLRPGGIGLKDGLLFAALRARAQGKIVGIPECEGAATAKSPWNAPELFNLMVLEGEALREWLFFDKPRRAFESGNRKQRSLPDYCGRGWHESRKQVMNEFGGLKRSYYMDPQPLPNIEWHLYEYEINKCDACALYRLELKAVGEKKSAKGKPNNDSVADLQKQMGRLSADFPSDNKRSVKEKAKENAKSGGSIYSTPSRVQPTNDSTDYALSSQYDYLIENIGDYFGP